MRQCSPIYGKIFLSFNTRGFVITNRQDTMKVGINPKMPIGLKLEFVDPDNVFLGFNVSVTYDPKLTTTAEIESLG